MYALALPRESRSNEVCVEMNRRKTEKTSMTLSIVTLKNQQILIIFGGNIFDATGC